MVKLAITPSVTYKLKIPESVSDHYAERAAKSGVDAETEIVKTLSRCQGHNASSPIYLDDDDRNTISQLAGRALRTPEDVVNLIEQLVTVRVSGVEVPLHHQLLKRLESRCFGCSFSELVRRVVTESLESYVGLR